MKDLEGLRLQALLSIAKGEGPGHPFRGNQWTRRASRGRAAPKDPTAGSQGGGSGKAKSTLDILRRELDSRGTPKPAGKDEYTITEYTGGKFNLRIKESALPKSVLEIHRKAQNGSTGVDSVTMHPDKASALKATKNPAQALATHYEQMKERAKDGLLDASSGGKAGKQMRDARLSAFKTAETALSELAALGYKPTATSKPAKKTKQQLADERQSLLSADANRPPAKAPTAPKPTKAKTKKEKDAEWEALTPKQKKIYEKAPADLSHDDAIALALGK